MTAASTAGEDADTLQRAQLVGKIQETARSVAETAGDLGRSAENVNGSTEEVGLSMEKIAGGPAYSRR